MHAATLLSLQARANRLANHRLHKAMAALTVADLHAPRSAFFPTLMATLNHVLEVDQYYVGALHGDAGLAEHWHRFVPDGSLAPLAGRQRLVDERLIAFCDALGDTGCQRQVEMPRRGFVQRDAAAFVLQHLFMHQTHHRGQVHAMLSGTAVAPPQLDEFLMPSDAPLRAAEMAALGWNEAAVYGPRP
ncbi:MAG: DinB family protein [Rubrivivax sp.]|nr:DinB family protein [Rubrivivax sp.]